MSATAPSQTDGAEMLEEQRLLDEGQWDDDGRGGYKRYLHNTVSGEIVHQAIEPSLDGEWLFREKGRGGWRATGPGQLAEVLQTAEEWRPGAKVIAAEDLPADPGEQTGSDRLNRVSEQNAFRAAVAGRRDGRNGVRDEAYAPPAPNSRDYADGWEVGNRVREALYEPAAGEMS